MVDFDTFLTTFYVLSDDFFKASAPDPQPQSGRPTALTPGEVIRLVVLSQWLWFRSQRDFYRWAVRHLKAYFPHLPDRSQYNRLLRAQRDALAGFSLFLVQQLEGQNCPYELLDTTGVPTRHVKRKGPGWLTGQSAVGWCSRIGWFQGFRLLVSTTPSGLITGFGFGAGNAKEQPLTDVFLALRARPHPRFASVGRKARGGYLRQIRALRAGTISSAGKKPTVPASSVRPARIPPLAESLARLAASSAPGERVVLFDKLHNVFRLAIDRPHALSGFQANLAANIALHNFCI